MDRSGHATCPWEGPFMMRAIAVGAGVICVALSLAKPTRVEAQNRQNRDVAAAVERGVETLKKMQRPDGTWQFMPVGGGINDKDVGCTALVGLALLEGNIPPNDPAITSAVSAVARQAPRLVETYAVAAAIMFLDKHDEMAGNRQFATLIPALGQKLLKEQFKEGGWSYGGQGNAAFTDNSNTQFAILGLWIARKHNVKVEVALLLAEKRFRDTQDQTGGWGYG